jgi:hypothetical protein
MLTHEECYEHKCNLFVILSHCHNGIFANGFCRTRQKANELVEKHGSRFNKHTVEGHILDQWFSGGVASHPTVGPSIEEQKDKVLKIWRDTPGDWLVALYAIYEAGMAEAEVAAQRLVQVTLEEAEEIRQEIQKLYVSCDPGPTPAHDVQYAINTVLVKRLEAAPAVAPETAAPVQEVPTVVPQCTGPFADDRTCPIHSRYKHTEAAAVTAQVELVDIALKAGAEIGTPAWPVTQGYRLRMANALAAVRPLIEAAAREGYWKQEDVEKAIGDVWTAWGAEYFTWVEFTRKLRAHLTPTPEPIEKLRCICGYDARNNERDHNVECFVPQDFAQNSPPPSGRSRNDQK